MNEEQNKMLRTLLRSCELDIESPRKDMTLVGIDGSIQAVHSYDHLWSVRATMNVFNSGRMSVHNMEVKAKDLGEAIEQIHKTYMKLLD